MATDSILTNVATPVGPEGIPSVEIVVIAYQAASTIVGVLERLQHSVSDRAVRVVVADDASTDGTAEIARALTYTWDGPATMVVERPVNLGYGGNQIACYRAAIDRGVEHVAVLHGDGQYPPEYLDALLTPLLDDRADAVLGSRMTTWSGALRGGMPVDRYLGNRGLSWIQNRLVGVRLSEWHTGFRSYRVATLAHLDLEALPDGFDFDTAMTLQLLDDGARLAEVAIPTHYGDEVSHIRPYRTGLRILGRTLSHRARRSAVQRTRRPVTHTRQEPAA